MLTVLAMLAPKWALRVAPGGSAPPIPSAARRDMLSSGRDGKAGASTELESWPGSGGKVSCLTFAPVTFLTGRKSVFSNGDRQHIVRIFILC